MTIGKERQGDMTGAVLGPRGDSVVILGAGYAGITVAQQIFRLSRGGIPVTLVDRDSRHVLRTELYQVDRLISNTIPPERWAVPIPDAVDGAGRSTTYLKGEVESIDLPSRTVRVNGQSLSFSALIICLGSVPAYFGIPGARENTHDVYDLGEALRTAQAIAEQERHPFEPAGAGRPRVVVVGGGSTGSEVAAEVASADWSRVGGEAAPSPSVVLVTGSVPLLNGLDERSIHHARSFLSQAGVRLVEEHNVQSVARRFLTLDDGTTVPFDVCVWCAGVEAPPVVRAIPTAHGQGGRLRVSDTLELPDHPGVFALGDVIDIQDPISRLPVPSTAQAAMAEAAVVAENVVAELRGKPRRSFVYRRQAIIVPLGGREAVGNMHQVSIWGRPARLLKALSDREYSFARTHGRRPLRTWFDALRYGVSPRLFRTQACPLCRGGYRFFPSGRLPSAFLETGPRSRQEE